MQRLIFLHTNDIHGDELQFARLVRHIQRIRAEDEEACILFLDAGDSQDKEASLSRATKGVLMHQLLGAAGCSVTVLGNKAMKRWGMGIVADYSMHIPVLLANLRLPDGRAIPGTQPYISLDCADLRIGVIGVTANDAKYVAYHHLEVLDTWRTIQHYEKALWQEHAVDTVILLSHLGWADDLALARRHDFGLPLIIGGHSHVLRAEGDRVADTLIVQAGSYARYLGRVDAVFDGRLRIERAGVIPIPSATEPDPTLMALIEQAKSQIESQD